MNKSALLLAIVSVALEAPLCVAMEEPAQGSAQPASAVALAGYKLTASSPIFGQMVLMSFPHGFEVVFENTRGDFYIREAVPSGQSVNNWTEMITITGNKGLAADQSLTPKRWAERQASGWQRACPASFAARGLLDGKLSGHDAFVVVLSCGTSPAANKASETVVIVVIKGESDYYSVQWAERAEASSTPLPIDTAKWTRRIQSLEPIKLCPIVPGEGPVPVTCMAGP